ncbi:MAG TPA: VOC family protein [Steroidobacteraceae bacterium]|jgi:predicted enzyme related to lactoylglutathione lyase|nr:VOC family protein [Steroidobacteraceae bacterium]
MKVERFGVYLRVASLEHSRAFYEPVLGRQPYVSNAQIVGFDVAGALFALYANPAEEAARGCNVVPYIRVQSADAEFARLKALDVELLDDRVIVEGPLKLFRFADPDGNVLELFSLNA